MVLLFLLILCLMRLLSFYAVTAGIALSHPCFLCCVYTSVGVLSVVLLSPPTVRRDFFSNPVGMFFDEIDFKLYEVLKLIIEKCYGMIKFLMMKCYDMLYSLIKKLGVYKCNIIVFLIAHVSDLVIRKIILAYRERILFLDILSSVLSLTLWLFFKHAFFGVCCLVFILCLWHTHPASKVKLINLLYSMYFIRLACDLIFIVMWYPVRFIDYYLIELPLDFFYSSGGYFSKSEVFYLLHMFLWHILIPLCLYLFAAFWVFQAYIFVSVLYMMCYVCARYN